MVAKSPFSLLYEDKGENIRRKCGFEYGINVYADSSKGDLCLAKKKEVIVSLRSFSKNHIDVLVK